MVPPTPEKQLGYLITDTNEEQVAPHSQTALDFEEGVLAGISESRVGQEPSAAAYLARRIGYLTICLVGLLLFGRLFYLQIISGLQLSHLAESNRLRQRVVLAPRGEIADRDGQILAQNKPGFRLMIVPKDTGPDTDNRASQLAAFLNLNPGEITAKLTKISRQSPRPEVLASNLSSAEAILFFSRASEYPGFFVEAIPIRKYTSGEAFAHVLGITGAVSPEDLKTPKKDYSSEDVVGRGGLEQQYEPELRGTNGSSYNEVDALGNAIKSLGENPPTPGHSMKLTLNKGLQEQLYQEFQKRPHAKGAAVAMDPKSGEVLALVSYPSFDPNLFAGGISSAQFNALLANPQLPLFNRSIAAQLPPGSTVKPMVALAALEEKVVDKNTIIYDKGKISVKNEFNPSIVYDYVGWKRSGLGPQTTSSAIAMSSDIYFYVVGGGLVGTNIDGLGPTRLTAYYRKFGLGQVTGIDLPGEKSGLVPDPAWKSAHFNADPLLGKWYLGDTYHISIGQGDMLVTPLQVALWTAAFANNGRLMKPFLVKAISDATGKEIKRFQPQPLSDKIGSDENIKIVQKGLREAVLFGTAKKLQGLGISVAGKTGTAQFDDNTKEHSWFTAYAPFEDPQIVITVLVEGGGEGGAAALPITAEALKWWSEHPPAK